MNEQEIDKLFQKNLSGYTKVPSNRALEKIQGKIYDRRRATWIRFSRIAAAILLIAISVGIISKWDSSEEIAVKPGTQVQPSVTQVNPPRVAEVENPVKQQSKLSEQTIVASNQPRPQPLPQSQETNSTVPTETEKSPGKAAITESPPLDLGITEYRLAKAEDQLAIAEDKQALEKPKKRKVTITYKRSQNTEPQHAETLAATEKRHKNTMLKSFWKKAVKVNQQNISLAGIRATKDELLAINKKAKNRENKPD